MQPERLLVAALALCAAAGAARAHGALPGAEGFYAGMVHVYQEPVLMIGLAAVLLTVLQDWPERFRMASLVFAASMVAGLLTGRDLAGILPLDLSLLLTAATLAAAAALAGDRGSPLLQVPLAAIGLLLGAACLPDPGPPADVLVTTAGGAAIALFGLLALCGWFDAVPERYRGPMLGLGLRIAAAWISAIAVMLAALLAGGAG